MITEKNNLKDIVFINYWKLSQNFTSAIKILSKEVFAIHVWLSLRYFLTFIYGNVINKAKKFKSDTSKLINSLKNLIRKSYNLATIVRPSKRNVGSRTRLLWGPGNRLRLLSNWGSWSIYLGLLRMLLRRLAWSRSNNFVYINVNELVIYLIKATEWNKLML
jgi:hypothetical protein